MQHQKYLWAIILALVVTYSSLETPFDLLFKIEKNRIMIFFHTLIPLFFLFDIYISYKEDLKKRHAEHVLVGNHKKFKPFVYTIWFPILLLSSIPYDLLCSLFLPVGFKLLKFVRILVLIKIFKRLKHLHAPTYFKLSLIFISLIIAVHFIACTWLYIYPDPNLSWIDSYVKAFYWAITTLTTTGYGDITPTTSIGRLFNIIVMLIGFSAFGILVGQISSLIYSKSRTEEENRQKMEDLRHFMKYYEIPPNLSNQVFEFYHHLISKKISENDTKIMAELPHSLQNELQIFMKIKLISTIPVFHSLSHDCLRDVSTSLSQAYFSKGDHIIKIGDHGEEMYIIDHGDVVVTSKEGKMLAKMGQGQCFGEIALLLDMNRTADVSASSYCDLYKFSKNDFNVLSTKYPELRNNFEKIMKKRVEDKK